MKLCKTGLKVAVIHGTNEETPDESNIMKILDVTEWFIQYYLNNLDVFVNNQLKTIHISNIK